MSAAPNKLFAPKSYSDEYVKPYTSVIEHQIKFD